MIQHCRDVRLHERRPEPVQVCWVLCTRAVPHKIADNEARCDLGILRFYESKEREGKLHCSMRMRLQPPCFSFKAMQRSWPRATVAGCDAAT